jgi:hypothetical protein
MKKNIALVVFLVGALLVSGCGVLTSKSGFTDDYIQSCYDLGGLMSKDGVSCGGSNCGNKNSPAENTDISCEVELARMGLRMELSRQFVAEAMERFQRG